MSELVCLDCGKEMEYDWAPCPNCGWKPPEPWEMTEEDEEFPAPKMILNKPHPWVRVTVWLVLITGLWGLFVFAYRWFR